MAAEKATRDRETAEQKLAQHLAQLADAGSVGGGRVVAAMVVAAG